MLPPSGPGGYVRSYTRRPALIDTVIVNIVTKAKPAGSGDGSKRTLLIDKHPTILNQRHTRVIQQNVRQECRSDQHFLLQRHLTTQVIKRPVEIHPEIAHHFTSEARLRALEAQVAALAPPG